jgi:hypothetical protein
MACINARRILVEIVSSHRIVDTIILTARRNRAHADRSYQEKCLTSWGDLSMLFMSKRCIREAEALVCAL